MKRVLSGRIRYALVLVTAALAIPVVALAEGLNDWSSTETGSALHLTASPGGTVSGWAAMSVEWRSKGASDAGARAALDVDETSTTLPTPHAVSTVAMWLPSPWGDGDYVWDAQRINFQAPDVPGTYTYVVKWAGGGTDPAGAQDLTIVLSVG